MIAKRLVIQFITIVTLIELAGCVSRQEKARQSAAIQSENAREQAQAEAEKVRHEAEIRAADARREDEIKTAKAAERQKEVDEQRKNHEQFVAQVLAVLPAERRKDVIYWVAQPDSQFGQFSLFRTVECQSGQILELGGLPVPCGSIFVNSPGEINHGHVIPIP